MPGDFDMQTWFQSEFAGEVQETGHEESWYYLVGLIDESRKYNNQAELISHLCEETFEQDIRWVLGDNVWQPQVDPATWGFMNALVMARFPGAAVWTYQP